MIDLLRPVKGLFASKKVSSSSSLRQVGGLDVLPLYESGTVVALTGSNELQGRLMGMGLLVGSTVTTLQESDRLGRPILIAVGETRIAVGKEIARTVVVEF
ncbi:MAG: ferrous iron transport protein A [Planctomycetaceae bacterium]|jgi:Fe2+ transport system protein FeoA|nr:ferrous iron transport protein A [Planctomycetaceae bacterium]